MARNEVLQKYDRRRYLIEDLVCQLQETLKTFEFIIKSQDTDIKSKRAAREEISRIKHFFEKNAKAIPKYALESRRKKVAL